MDKKICIFMTAIQYPCGEGSSCCGPIGQKEEEVVALKNAIEEHFKFAVEIIDVINKDKIKEHKNAAKLINTFGLGILPIVTSNGDVVSMGKLDDKEIVEQLLKK